MSETLYEISKYSTDVPYVETTTSLQKKSLHYNKHLAQSAGAV